VCELKFDGVSISLIYENRQLIRAVTRGDGIRGDDVTTNVRTIHSIPLVLYGDHVPFSIEARGEIIMSWKVFEELNKEREAQEEPLFANPAMRPQEPSSCKTRARWLAVSWNRLFIIFWATNCLAIVISRIKPCTQMGFRVSKR